MAGVVVFEDVQDTISGGSSTSNRFILEDPIQSFVAFEAERRIHEDDEDPTTDFLVFESPLPVVQAVDAGQDFLLIDSPKTLNVQMEDGNSDFLVIFGNTGLPGPEGDPGPPGPPGADGADGENVPYYAEFNFASPLTSWVITHSQDMYRIVVETFDQTGAPINGVVEYTDSNTITVSWYYPTAGSARLFN